jgi:hypothetical protein
MNASEFIREKLLELHGQFSNLTIKSGFDESINTHIVNITPISEFRDNKELEDRWFLISIEFMKLYPDEGIAFITDDSYLNLDKAEFVLDEDPKPKRKYLDEIL